MNNHVIIICGQRGCGKSTYLNAEIDKFDRVIIYDLLGENLHYETAFNMEQYVARLNKKQKAHFFVLNFFDPKTDEECFSKICISVNRLHDVLFVVDELDYHCNANYIPKDLAEIIKRGRHQQLNLMVATRRPHEIPRLMTSQVSQFITFRQVEPRDLDYLNSVCSFNKEEVKNLPNFHYLKWENGVITRGQVSRPKPKKKWGNKNVSSQSNVHKSAEREEMEDSET
jgi:hypothetical protein